VYQIQFRELMPTEVPRLQFLCSQLQKLLAAWAQDQVIELIATVPNLKKEFRYE
jgi:hypothetical protein